MTIAFGLLAAGIAVLGLLSARSGIALFGSLQGTKTIALSAALIWIFFGLVLAYQAAKPFGRWTGLTVQEVLTLIAASCVFELGCTISGTNCIVELFFVSIGTLVLGPVSSPISPVALILSILAAVALILAIGRVDPDRKQSRSSDMTGIIGLVISIISFTFGMSYLYGNPLLYGTGLIPIAFISALSAFFIGAALVTAAGPGAVPVRFIVGRSTTARLLRVFIPLVGGIVVIGNLVFVALPAVFRVHDAVLLSATLVVFLLITSFVVARVSGTIGSALDRAEQALARKNEDLGAMNEELMAIEEELRQNVDELTRTGSELRESQKENAFLADLLHRSEQPFGVGYPDGRLGIINGAFERLTGYNADELKTLDWATVLTPPEWREPEHRNLEELNRTGLPVRYEKEYVRKDGSRVPIELLVQLVRGDDGNPLHYFSFITDITERKRAEDAIRESGDRLKFALETSHTGAWDLDLIDHTAFRSEEHDRIFGYPGLLPQWTYEMFLEHIMPEDRDDVDAKFRKAMETKGDWSFECRIRRTDGEIRWIWAAGRHRAGSSGGLTRIAGIVQDITGRKLAEAEIVKSRELLRAIIDNAPSFVYVIDREKRFTVANKALADLLGMSPGELIGRSRQGLMPEGNARQHEENDLRVMETGLPLDFEEEGIFRGRRATYFTTKFPIRDTAGTITAIGGISTDITERKRAEEELRQKNDDLNALNEELTATEEELHQNLDELTQREEDLSRALSEKEVLLSEIHHRVKNNLTAFISLLSLEGSTEESPSGKLLKQDLQNRARSMALIHETLYRTHMYNEVDMGLYLTTLLDQIAASFNTAQSVKTIVDVRGVTLDIPRATPAGLIINELVTNAFKYAFPASFDTIAVRNAPPTITIALAKSNGEYLLTVKDNGVGLPAGFDPVKTQTLGLKLVNFLAKHQLRAKLAVATGEGTEFTIRFKE
jgi:PAS domain S-box-containing protein